MKVTTGLTAPGEPANLRLRPDLSRGSSPPVPPLHGEDYDALDDAEPGWFAAVVYERRSWWVDNVVWLALAAGFMLGVLSTVLGMW